MNTTVLSVFSCIGLFLGMWGAAAYGARAGRAASSESGDGSGAVVGAIFALLGLLMAFTFSSAFSRLEARRQLIVEEANAIGTAYMRIDLVRPESQPALRDKLRRYAQSRAQFHTRLVDPAQMSAALAVETELQQAIWTESVAACKLSGSDATSLLLPAVNAMLDVTTARMAAVRAHSPVLIFATLFGIALACAGLAGYTARGGLRRAHVLAFSGITAFTIYVILDVEFPTYGLIRLDRFNGILLDVVAKMQ